MEEEAQKVFDEQKLVKVAAKQYASKDDVARDIVQNRNNEIREIQKESQDLGKIKHKTITHILS